MAYEIGSLEKGQWCHVTPFYSKEKPPLYRTLGVKTKLKNQNNGNNEICQWKTEGILYRPG